MFKQHAKSITCVKPKTTSCRNYCISDSIKLIAFQQNNAKSRLVLSLLQLKRIYNEKKENSKNRFVQKSEDEEKSPLTCNLKHNLDINAIVFLLH